MNIKYIIDMLGGEAYVASICKVHQTSVAAWIRSQRIPLWYWEPIISVSKGKINAGILLKACSKNKNK